MKQKNRYGMPPPSTRAEFEHNVYLTIEALVKHKDDGDYLANRMWILGDSLNKLKELPNGRIVLSSIDEKLRLHSNMMDWEKYLPPIIKREE